MKYLMMLIFTILIMLLFFGCNFNSAVSEETAVSTAPPASEAVKEAEIDPSEFKGDSRIVVQFLVDNKAQMETIAREMLEPTKTMDSDDYVMYEFSTGELMHHQVEGQEETLIPVLDELKPQFSQLAVQENCLFQYCLSYPQVPLWGGNGCSFYYYTVDKNGFPSGAIELLYYSTKDGIQTNNLIWLDARWAIIEYE